MPGTINKIHDMVLSDKRVKVREIAAVMNISTKRILHNELNMKKFSTKWMPCLFIAQKKRVRIRTSANCLEVFKKNPTNFVFFVTIDKT